MEQIVYLSPNKNMIKYTMFIIMMDPLPNIINLIISVRNYVNYSDMIPRRGVFYQPRIYCILKISLSVCFDRVGDL